MKQKFWFHFPMVSAKFNSRKEFSTVNKTTFSFNDFCKIKSLV